MKLHVRRSRRACLRCLRLSRCFSHPFSWLVSRSLFVPLSLAVGFAMLASYLLSNTLVPVLSTWLLREKTTEEEKESFVHKVQTKYQGLLHRLLPLRWAALAIYLV